jgi:ribonuclease BN (tRNA processing enzyme)
MACGGVEAAALRSLVEQQLTAPLFPTLVGVTDALMVEAFDASGCFNVSATCEVHALPARHPGGASVLVVRDATGPVMAYAPDNELSLFDTDAAVVAWRSSLIDGLRGIPVLIHDATYVDDELSRHRGWGHSSAAEATELAMSCGADVLLLTHHHPDRTDAQVDALVEECRARVEAAGSALVVAGAAEGMVLEVA